MTTTSDKQETKTWRPSNVEIIATGCIGNVIVAIWLNCTESNTTTLPVDSRVNAYIVFVVVERTATSVNAGKPPRDGMMYVTAFVNGFVNDRDVASAE